MTSSAVTIPTTPRRPVGDVQPVADGERNRPVGALVEADFLEVANQRQHVGRARRLARDDDARQRRTAVLRIPASLVSLQACLAAADHLITSAEAEAKAQSEELDAGETEALQVALGAGGTGKGAAASARGSAGAVRDLEKRQKSRATRAQRDALDRALVDLAAFYRDVLLVQSGSAVPSAHPDFADDVRAVAAQLSSAATLQFVDVVLACRLALSLNVKPRIAVEAMTTALRLP